MKYFVGQRLVEYDNNGHVVEVWVVSEVRTSEISIHRAGGRRNNPKKLTPEEADKLRVSAFQLPEYDRPHTDD